MKNRDFKLTPRRIEILSSVAFTDDVQIEWGPMWNHGYPNFDRKVPNAKLHGVGVQEILLKLKRERLVKYTFDAQVETVRLHITSSGIDVLLGLLK